MHYHDAMKTIPKAHLKELQNCIFCIITTWSLFYLIPIYISLYFLLFLWKKKIFSPLSGLMCVLFWTPFHIHKLIAFVFFINSTELWSKDVFMILRNIFSLHQANKKHQLQIYLLVTSTFGCNARRDNSESSFWYFSKRVLNFN